MLKFTNPWFGNEEIATLVTDNYVYNNRQYIGLFTYDTEWKSWEPYCDLTVNLPDEPLSNESCAFVDTNNCPWAVKFIEENGLGKPTGMMGFSGWCAYPEVEFCMDEVNKNVGFFKVERS